MSAAKRSLKTRHDVLDAVVDASAQPHTVDSIQDCLTTAIVDHHLPPGTKLGEEAIAEFFRVGRPRVHEALLKLSHNGLVTLQPNRGAFVTIPSLNESKQICEARRTIELDTVRLAARRATSQDIARLEQLAAQEMQAWTGRDRHNAVRLSRKFHLQIAQIAGNDVLFETMRNILNRNMLSAAHYVRRGFSGCMCDEHNEIAKAICERNEEHARELMRIHLDHIEEFLTTASDEETVDIHEALKKSISSN